MIPRGYWSWSKVQNMQHTHNVCIDRGRNAASIDRSHDYGCGA